MTQWFAHRGVSIAKPENTMAAFKLAEEKGADGIELDVQLTRDNKVIVMHDLSINRTTNGRGTIRSKTWDDLKKLDAGSWFGGTYEPIPLLEDVVSWLSGNTLLVNIELKGPLKTMPDLIRAVKNIVEPALPASRVIISSFHHPTVVSLHEEWKEPEKALLVSSGLYKPLRYLQQAEVFSLHVKRQTISDKEMVELMEQGITVRVFTVNDEKALQRLINLQVDGIMTDHGILPITLSH
ncbi:glycerophosphoryl diester phosphodiesterase [Sinobaca qinghaiensis]|uniref:Glycerophosphoryl diester phosphodiesterase n=1 Tax=Sinobaca qinghaiensis TaxID=342944 RepID=A0A419V7J5_9BACL|nr:glycerophosphodiester phosphodiesterase family protein [Sinobaca qinghaiensis]RKD76022.1 glycerophosphoryl diester phosphodiesterase [Sinobaca qinghaiensis]